MKDAVSAPARLLRGFAIEFLTSHDVTVVPRIMDPDYRLTIGGHVFAGRDAVYLPATAAQLEQFPGLCVTVHDVMLGPDALAMRFTEHGASQKNGGRIAAWGGVTMFRISDGRLRHGWADEDYFARKRQLATGVCDPVKAPHPAPWDVAVEGPNEAAADAVRAWLENPHALSDAAKVDEISAQGPSLPELIVIETISIDELLSAGERVACRIVAQGNYAGGFADIERPLIGQRIALSGVGLLAVHGGQVANAQFAYDRLGLHRSLLRRP